MTSEKKRPLIIVPQCLKEWFTKASCPDESVTLFSEVRGIDPTMPGLDEFESLIRNDDDFTDDPEDRPKPRLVTLDGHHL